MFMTFNEYIKKKFKNNDNKYNIAKKYKYLLFKKFCDNINIEYIKKKCEDENNKILLYSINNKEYKDIIGIIMYRIILNNKNLIRIYICIMSIKEKMRKYGYGQLLLNELINKFNIKNKIIEIVLLSVPESYEFYINNNFYECNIKYIKNNEDISNNIMMKKIINKYYVNNS